MKWLFVWLGLALGNFIYAWFRGDYYAAADHSYFQGVAIAIAYCVAGLK